MLQTFQEHEYYTILSFALFGLTSAWRAGHFRDLDGGPGA